LLSSLTDTSATTISLLLALPSEPKLLLSSPIHPFTRYPCTLFCSNACFCIFFPPFVFTRFYADLTIWNFVFILKLGFFIFWILALYFSQPFCFSPFLWRFGHLGRNFFFKLIFKFLIFIRLVMYLFKWVFKVLTKIWGF